MKRLPLALITIAALSLGACRSDPPPDGNRAGRIDPYRSTEADRAAPEASSVVLLEFADQVSQQLAVRLANVPEIQDAPTKVVVEMGAIENETYTPTSDFRRIRRSIFLNMVNSDVITNVADIVESPELMDEQARRLAPQDMEPVGARYDPDIVYVLQGSFGEIRRGGDSTYIFDATVTHLASRRLVFAEQYTSKQDR
ncbi:MAG: hypothetical protein AAFX05_07515 [Planctomycetota bacterium]